MSSKLILKIFFTLILAFIVYSLYLYISRLERFTEISYPERFLSSEDFCKDKEIRRLSFSPNQIQDLQVALNSLTECTFIKLSAGNFTFNNALTINGVNGILLEGTGKSLTTIQFKDAGNVNGVDVEASNSFTIRNLRVLDSPKNGVEIRLSENIIIDNIEVTWSNRSGESMKNNGAYGVYPVNVVNVVLQNTDTFYASDAGLYVGQCINAWVRNNRAEFNVMGLEIENTINADVHDNIVMNNTGGFLAYDLNKNTIVSRNIRVYKNKITNNNNPNFANTGIVKTVPAGVGIILTSIRDIEIYDNEIGNNKSTDVAIINGLVSETPNFSEWPMNNWRAYNIHIHNNRFLGGSGSSVDNGNTNEKDRPLGVLVAMVFDALKEKESSGDGASFTYPNMIYDGVEPGYTLLTMTTWFGDIAGNHNQICLNNNDKGKFSPILLDMNLPALLNNSEDPTKESIASAIERGATLTYKSDDNYGGNPPNGFNCEGYKFQGMPKVEGIPTL
ncbi:MAG: right-handed parallel beta-helix repeat-containing protein [Leptospira sp.]|nr:right-handed parallel beta-helix repeat-containing protein [Leptospira sp.]